MINFPLHTLGWKAFQDLTASILGEVMGQTFQTFLTSRDGGRDGAFAGTWHPNGGEEMTGTFTVQCKFFSAAATNLTVSDVADELEKARRLVAKGIADNYILMTNGGISGTTEEQLRFVFLGVGVKQFRAYGYDWINRQLNERPRLRRLAPRVYGLGDLSEILDERVLDQTREILATLGDDLGKFVTTAAYRKSELALHDHRFVLLLGEPSAGKSTIAAALALGAADDWECLAIKTAGAADFRRHWNPNDPRRLFWIDDAFGSTQLDADAARAWNSTFHHVRAAMRQGARVVMTSRDYVFRAARPFLQSGLFPALNEHQVVVRVEELSKEEREQILYNHLRLGDQPRDFRTRVKPFLHDVAASPRFIPEIAKRLGNSVFTTRLILNKTSVTRFVEEPVEFLVETVRGLDSASFSALAAIFIRGGMLGSPITLSSDEVLALARLSGSIGTVTEGLARLNESMVRMVIKDGFQFWIFRHPTIRDAIAALVAENAELSEIYLLGVTTDRLMSEVVCGEVHLEGSKVRLSPSQFPAVITRLKQFSSENTAYTRDRVNIFLSFRCDRSFLTEFLRSTPGFVENLRVGSYLNAITDVDVLARLNEFNLLTSAEREKTTAAVRHTVLTTPDAGFLHPSLAHLLDSADRAALLSDVELRVIPRLTEIVRDERFNMNHGDDPEDHFASLRDQLNAFDEALPDKPAVSLAIRDALQKIDDYVEELQNEELDWDPDGEPSRYHDGASSQDSSRSIFDDIDS